MQKGEKKNTVVEAVSTKKFNKKTMLIIAVAVLLTVGLSVGIIASATSSQKPEVLTDDVTEGVIESVNKEEESKETEEEVANSSKEEKKESSKKTAGNNKKPAKNNKDTNKEVILKPANIADDEDDKILRPEEHYEEVKILTINVQKINPKVNFYSKEAFGTITVTVDGKDITSTCTVKVDAKNVDNTKSGVYHVGITADCGANGKAARTAAITLNIPPVKEQKNSNNNSNNNGNKQPVENVTENKSDKDKEVAPANQELTTIVLITNDGRQLTFIKNEVEDAYAKHTKKVMVEAELASNVKVAADYSTITVAGRTFTVQK